MSTTDRIEKRAVLRASRARVWRALSDSKEFGTWFRCALDGPFVAGATVRGRITIPQYAHVQLELHVERVEHERLLSFRWHPYSVDASIDYSQEPTTLVELALEEVSDGTQLTIVESGFDRIPASRRELAFRMNGEGWTAQLRNIGEHVAA